LKDTACLTLLFTFEPAYLASNTALRSDEAKKFRSTVEKMQNEDIEKIPAFEDIETRIGRFLSSATRPLSIAVKAWTARHPHKQ
jgi:hypothetical protein